MIRFFCIWWCWSVIHCLFFKLCITSYCAS